MFLGKYVDNLWLKVQKSNMSVDLRIFPVKLVFSFIFYLTFDSLRVFLYQK